MMYKKKIYTILFTGAILPGVNIPCQAIVPYYNRQYKINSITWDFRARLELAPLSNIPLEQNTTIEMALEFITLPVGTPIGQGYLNPTPAGFFANNAIAGGFYKPGKRNFDSFFVSNELDIILNVLNRDMLNAIRFYSYVILEIENNE